MSSSFGKVSSTGARAAGAIALNCRDELSGGTPVPSVELALTLESEKQKPCPSPKGTGMSVQGAGRDTRTL